MTESPTNKPAHRELLLATNNPGKLEELRQLLAELPLELLSPADIGLEMEVEEDGQTYAENATKKALAFARTSGRLTLADDSGLEVDALGGEPGLRSARYSPAPGASDRDRRVLLLEKLRGQPGPWTARFRCWIAVAEPGGAVELAEGVCEGAIIPVERGTGGFGYDPIFLVAGKGRTMAELGMEEKNQVSHRARAVMAANESTRLALVRKAG